MTTRTLHLQKCAPAAAHLIEAPQPIFADRHQYAVHAEMDGDGDMVTTTGIAFEDYRVMTTQIHKRSGERRLPTPEWALDQTKLRAVIVRYFECRAFGSGLRKHPIVGTEKERLARAQAKLVLDKEKKLAILDGLCREYVALKKDGSDPARVRKLEQLIEGLDTQIALVDRGPAPFVAMIYFYYSLRMDSVGTAEALSIKPPAVRQSLFRLSNVWKELNGEPALPQEKGQARPHQRSFRSCFGGVLTGTVGRGNYEGD
jgi:hypothetical protein